MLEIGIPTTFGSAIPKLISSTKSDSENHWCDFRMVPDLPRGATRLCVIARDLRSFEIRFKFESAVRFDSKVMGRF